MDPVIYVLGWVLLGVLAYAAIAALVRFTIFRSPWRCMRGEAWSLAALWPYTAPLYFVLRIIDARDRRRGSRCPPPPIDHPNCRCVVIPWSRFESVEHVREMCPRCGWPADNVLPCLCPEDERGERFRGRA